jgi:hypothetical protein
MKSALYLSIPTLVVLALAACGDSTDAGDSSAAVKESPAGGATAQTPSSPGNLFRVDYEIIGTPVVGSPVSIDLAITSLFGDEPVDLAFRIPDATALIMDAAQPRDLRRTPSSDNRTIRERVTVIPQREGRLFINVSASRTDEAGSLTSAISIPLHVGNVDTSVREQGELQTNEEGETTRVLTSD